jgi:SpoIIAA-like
LLYQINKGISHFAWSSYLEDTKVSWYLLSFEKVAIFSDIQWIDESVKLFAFMMPMPVKAFTGDRLDEAKAWVSEQDNLL